MQGNPEALFGKTRESLQKGQLNSKSIACSAPDVSNVNWVDKKNVFKD
jgi:hypothetical protein